MEPSPHLKVTIVSELCKSERGLESPQKRPTRLASGVHFQSEADLGWAAKYAGDWTGRLIPKMCADDASRLGLRYSVGKVPVATSGGPVTTCSDLFLLITGAC